MRTVFLIGFRGTGYRTEAYRQESLLIRVGHVGFALEGDGGRVFGFHPTAEAAQAIGDDVAIVAHLKRFGTIPGTIHDDTAIFRRAHELATRGVRTQVWQLAITASDEEFQRILALTLLWYTEQRLFTYAFPSEPRSPDRDNCATFPRRLGLTPPELTGQLVNDVPLLAEGGQRWQPQEDEDEPSAT